MRERVYLDELCIYDSADQGRTMLAGSVVKTLNEAGYAEVTLPYDYDFQYEIDVIPLRTLVRIVREAGVEDDPLLFRGRLLSVRDSLYGSKTLVCEGELAFLKDSVIRPQTFTGTLYQIFAGILSRHNGQVEAWKRFLAGACTVTTEESSPSITVNEATSTSAVFAQLISTYGGYIAFETDAETGYRVITWHGSDLGTSSQEIRLGVNLMDYASDLAVSDFANRVIPYGKRVNDNRVTISVGGHDYVEDTASQAVYGVIARAVEFDDVETPAVLEQRAREYLARSVVMARTISLSALDLSVLSTTAQTGDYATGSWSVGQLVRVVIEPRGVDVCYMLTQRTYDLLDPSRDTIVMGGSPVSLTGEINK